MKSLNKALVAAGLAWITSGPDVFAQQSYLVRARDGQMDAAVSRVAASGGTVIRDLSKIGMIAVETANPAFASELVADASIEFLTDNPSFQGVDPDAVTYEANAEFGAPPNSGDDDVLLDLLWGHLAVDAVEAWNKGTRGAGVTVAVLDSGVDCTHPDIAPNLMLAKSASFVPGEGVCVRAGNYFNHGTHVSGTILGADNAVGMIGVAPEAKLIAVKVLSEFSGSGAFDWVIAGIVYATDQGADIINMSLGALLPKGGPSDGRDPNPVTELKAALDVATAYARSKGTLVIASAGNQAVNLAAGYVHLPSDADHVLSISAASPVDWAVNPSTDLDVPASYSNYGKNAIDFAGPGGDFDSNNFNLCTVGVVTNVCVAFDGVLSASPGGWRWASGTSMAAPHVAGVAALLKSKYPNAGVDRLRDMMKNWADKLGTNPGKDDFFGWGRIDAVQGITGSMDDLALDAPAMERVAADLPTAFALEPNYPNPFNPTTAIVFALPEQANTRLSVFDLLGREVAVLVDGALPAGRHEVLFQANDLPSGAYFFKIEAGSFQQIRQMMLMK